jgi:hypothetical protein
VTGLHSKKRPNDLIFSRMFDGRVLDQVELGIEGFVGMDGFSVSCSASFSLWSVRVIRWVGGRRWSLRVAGKREQR